MLVAIQPSVVRRSRTLLLHQQPVIHHQDHFSLPDGSAWSVVHRITPKSYMCRTVFQQSASDLQAFRWDKFPARCVIAFPFCNWFASRSMRFLHSLITPHDHVSISRQWATIFLSYGGLSCADQAPQYRADTLARFHLRRLWSLSFSASQDA
jgi:hypothetical protein